MADNRENTGGPFNSIVGILMVVGVILAIYYISSLVFRLLYFVSPVLLVATLIIDYKVVVNFVKWLVSLIKRNAILGIGATLLSLVAYPITSIFLLGSALFKRKVNQVRTNYQMQKEGELVDFEEIESRPSKLELPDLEKRTQQKDNDYEQLFD